MTHPEWNPAPSTGKDTLSRAGAEAIAEKIREAWRKCGHDVRVDVIPSGRDSKLSGGSMWVIRSNLIRGMPCT